MPVWILPYIITGILIGICLKRVAIYLIDQREKNVVYGHLLNKGISWLYWSAFTAGIYGVIGSLPISFPNKLEYMVLSSICLCIAMVDFKIKKIPNELLITLIVNRIVFLAINHDLKEITLSLVGMIAGFIIFLLPSYLKMNIGGGDIKFGAVVGFCLGAYNLFEVMIIMAAALSILTVYLIASKRGTLKSQAAMGPFISLGVIITIIFPLF